MKHEGVKVLVVEDDPSVRELTTSVLTRAGYRVSEAADGAIGLEALDTVKPAIVVLDVNMPNVDGFDFLTAMAKRSGARKPLVLVLTARNAAGDVKRCIALGAKDYLAKPFSNDVLLARVARLERRCAPPAGQSVMEFQDQVAMLDPGELSRFKQRVRH